MQYSDVRRYLGNSKQLFRAEEYRLVGGKGDGMRMFSVRNGAEMEFVCSADRGMDLHYLRCKGHSLGFLTSAGDVAPQYYDDRGLGWLRSFTAGFMSTCGPVNIGAPDAWRGWERGLHGRASNTPAEEAGLQVDETPDGISATLRGVLRETIPGQEHLKLTRVIRTEYASPCIHIRDTVLNCGRQKSLHMMLYHFNLGYPLLSEQTELLLPTRRVTPRDAEAAAQPELWSRLTPPEDGSPERCYYHDLASAPDGKTFVAAYQPALDIGVAIHFDRTVLDHFVQWRQTAAGYYVMGLEPCNATIDGIADAQANGSAKYLEPDQSVTYDLTIELLSSRDSFERLRAAAAQLR